MANEQNLKPWKPGQSGNPAGMKKGTKHISTWIQEMLNDEDFETMLLDSRKGMVEFKGAPLKAIIKTAVFRASQGDDKAREWLAKYGYGTKLDVTSDGEKLEGLVIIKTNDDQTIGVAESST